VEVLINNQAGLDANLSVKIQEADYSQELDKALKDYGRKMNVPGFRPGKIPTGVIRKMIGKDAKREVVEKVLHKSIYDYIESGNLKVVLSPLSTYHDEDIDWQQPDFEFSYDIGLKPTVNINLKPLNELTKHIVGLTDAEVKEDVHQFRKQSAKMEYADKYDKNEESYAWVKFTELDESGQPLEGGTEKVKNFDKDAISPKLAEILDGKASGFETTVKIADIFSEDEMATIFELDPLSLKDLFPDFKIELQAILKMTMPEMNEDYFKTEFPDGSVTTEEQFYEKWKTIMENHFNRESNNVLARDVKTALLEKTQIELPEQFIKKYFEMWAKENPNDSKAEDYDKDLESFRNDVKWQILAEQIAEQQTIEVSEEEVVHYAEGLIYNALRSSSPTELTPEKLKQYTNNYLTKDNNYNSASATVRDGKVFDWLLSQIEPVPETISKDRFEELKKVSQLS